MKALVQTC